MHCCLFVSRRASAELGTRGEDLAAAAGLRSTSTRAMVVHLHNGSDGAASVPLEIQERPSRRDVRRGVPLACAFLDYRGEWLRPGVPLTRITAPAGEGSDHREESAGEGVNPPEPGLPRRVPHRRPVFFSWVYPLPLTCLRSLCPRPGSRAHPVLACACCLR